MSKKTGYRRDYDDDPYKDYHKSPFAFFRSKKKPPGLPEKAVIFAVEVGPIKKVYPFGVLKKAKDGVLRDIVAGKRITVHFDKESEEVFAETETGEMIAGTVSYWFVWYSFHPDSIIYKLK